MYVNTMKNLWWLKLNRYQTIKAFNDKSKNVSTFSIELKYTLAAK